MDWTVTSRPSALPLSGDAPRFKVQGEHDSIHGPSFQRHQRGLLARCSCGADGGDHARPRSFKTISAITNATVAPTSPHVA